MILKIIVNLLVVFISIAIVVITKSLKIYKKNPVIFNNTNESTKGVASIVHENNSKKVSECFEGAEKTLKTANVDAFSLDNFFESIKE